MADLIMIVDTALAEVPVNILPLIDDTDFKTIEGAVAFNAAGMALRWHFTTTGGAYTVTSVTPTSAGDYDWTDQGDSGVYTIEIPASGGASINNDTEGFGWFTGVATGILPWRGPVIQFSPANVVNSLVNGSDALQVHAVEISNDLITAAALATDAVNEIADAVWDEDATGHQTQGTFGQAIGDPVADTNTIYKAVVTDAAGATVGVDVVAVKAETASIQADTNDIQARIPAALVGGRIDASVGAIAADTITAAALAADAGTEIGTAVWATAARTLTALDEDNTTLDLDATIRAAVGLAAANLDTQISAVQADTDNIQTRIPAALVGGRIDASVGAMAADTINASALATDAVNEIADGILNRDMATGTDSGSTTVRTPRQALRAIRNKWDITAGVLTVKKEDDATTSWTSAITGTAGADPVTTSDPAGP